ncbi:MAG: UbiD family decarboxylase [Nitrososphaerales archaeon]
MIAYRTVRRVILAVDDPTERKVRFMALLNSSLPKGGKRPILTGGSAIEVYLDGTLRTGDMDIVCKREALEGVLKSWRFELGRGLRSWANDELRLAVDMVGEELAGSYDRVSTITTDYGRAIVIGIEDLILKRLASAKFWGVAADMEQAYLLAKAHEGELDWEYLESEAKTAGIVESLHKLRSMLKRS